MKTNIKNTMVFCFALLLCTGAFSQNIKLSLANVHDVNDGGVDYYEADIMIQAIDGQADFKLGSGQVYLNYNTGAFGENVDAGGSFAVTADFSQGYLLGEKSGFTDFYNISFINDNTSSRVSWSFTQGVSSGAMTNFVTATARKLAKVRIRYSDTGEPPMVVFEIDESQVSSCRDQFFTACGPYDSATTTLDCSSAVSMENVNVQFMDAEFAPSDGTLSDDLAGRLAGFRVHPNPTKGLVYVDVAAPDSFTLVDMLGRVLRTGDFEAGRNRLSLRGYDSGVYFVRLGRGRSTLSKRVVLD